VALTLLPGNGLNRTSNFTPLLRSVPLTSLLTVSALAISLTTASAQNTTKARSASRGSSRGALSSRGSYNRAQAGLPSLSPKTLTGRVAVVSADQAIMRREFDGNSRILSKVPKGTNLALVYEAGAFYGVLMSDSSVGWVSKTPSE
jgi:hypothetical protein